MKKEARALALSRETVRELSADALLVAAGGATLFCPQPTTESQPSVCILGKPVCVTGQTCR